MAVIKLDEGWAAFSIDIQQLKTRIIHPGMAAHTKDLVLAKYKTLSTRLTNMAMSHLSCGGGPNLLDDWGHEVALSPQERLHP